MSIGVHTITRMDVTTFEWTGSVEPWKQIQQAIRGRVRVGPLTEMPRYVGGADCAFSRDGKQIRAAAVVYDRESQSIIERAELVQPCKIPYIPTYLSFREIPAILAVLNRLKHRYHALLVDGQGLAHPRRCGIAAHLGVLLDLPTIGCAKSRLIGTNAEPAPNRGSAAPLMDRDEQIGVVLRTRDNVNPLYVSVGHRVDLESAIRLTLACCTRYRLPEPTRFADQLSKFARPLA
jgi:deoxyribonuclease V